MDRSLAVEWPCKVTNKVFKIVMVYENHARHTSNCYIAFKEHDFIVFLCNCAVPTNTIHPWVLDIKAFVSVDRHLTSFLYIFKMFANVILVTGLIKCNSILIKLLCDALSLHVDSKTCLSVVGSFSFATLSPEHTRENLVVAIRLADCHNIDWVHTHFLLRFDKI